MTLVDIYLEPTTDTVYVDLRYAPDPILFKNTLTIYNKSLTNYYIKIATATTGYKLITPSTGHLGVVANGSSITPTVTFQRAKPSAPTNEDVVLTMKVYSDSSYTILIGEENYIISMVMEDYSDGTWTISGNYFTSNSESFTGGTWTNAYDFNGASGGCLYQSLHLTTSSQQGSYSTTANHTYSKSLTIPNKNNVRLIAYLANRTYATSDSGSNTSIINYLSFTVDSTEVSRFANVSSISSSEKNSAIDGWYGEIADISSYKNTTNTITIGINISVIGYNSLNVGRSVYGVDYIDNIEIISKD